MRHEQEEGHHDAHPAREQHKEEIATIADSSNTIAVQGAGRREYERSRRYFSVFAYTPTAEIKELSGVKYPLRDHTLTASFPLGVSNEITGGKAVLDVASGTVLVVESE